jgi:hypothetical protein
LQLSIVALIHNFIHFNKPFSDFPVCEEEMHRANRRLGSAAAKAKTSTINFKWVVKNVLLSPQFPRNAFILGGQ